MTNSVIHLLLLSMVLHLSEQSCSSTAAITTCTWDTLKPPSPPLRIPNYKTYLSFTKGNLQTIPDGSFKLLPGITVLQLSGNKLKQLNERSLEGLINLKQLNLYDNQLTAVNKDDLKHCAGLIKLDLGMNRISFVHDKAFEHLIGLEHLNLAFNALKAVPQATNSLWKLQVLKLDNNVIETIKANTFSQLNLLKELYLNDNKLNRIEQDGFKGLNDLKMLDLRSNFLTDIDMNDVMSDVRSLRKISLSINSFKCEHLSAILEGFGRYNVDVARGVSKSKNNVHGISCVR